MDRRTFLATTASTPLMALSHAQNLPEPSPSGEPSAAALRKNTIPTPALLVDADALEANLVKMADHCRRTKRQFRPHAKTHKCPEIARRQMAAGAIGISVATVPEAEAMVSEGIAGVLLTSPIVDPHKIQRMVRLVQQGQGVMLSVGNSLQADLLAEAAAAAQVDIPVLVDLDVGDRRTGVLPGEAAVQLAQRMSRSPRLQVRGVQAYAGHASHTVGFEARQRVSREALAKAVETKRLLQRAGFEATILSGGSTGTYNIDSEIDEVTELQVGSFVFMDSDYRRIGGRDGNPIYSDFQPSLTVLTTVVNATHPGRVTVDAGTKAIDTTTSHRVESKDWPGVTYMRAGDEFGALTFDPDGKRPALGDRLEFLVPHCDPSVNLYDRLYVCRGDHVEAIWPIRARRETLKS